MSTSWIQPEHCEQDKTCDEQKKMLQSHHVVFWLPYPLRLLTVITNTNQCMGLTWCCCWHVSVSVYVCAMNKMHTHRAHINCLPKRVPRSATRHSFTHAHNTHTRTCDWGRGTKGWQKLNHHLFAKQTWRSEKNAYAIRFYGRHFGYNHQCIT